jgi:hypothetical protein
MITNEELCKAINYINIKEKLKNEIMCLSGTFEFDNDYELFELDRIKKMLTKGYSDDKVNEIMKLELYEEVFNTFLLLD